MNPSYKIMVTVTLAHASEARDIQMQRVSYLPFAPRAGDILRLTDENDETNTIDLPLEGVVYDTANGMFLAELEDSTLADEYREHGQADDKQAVETYKAFGFVRTTFPTAQVIRAAATG